VEEVTVLRRGDPGGGHQMPILLLGASPVSPVGLAGFGGASPQPSGPRPGVSTPKSTGRHGTRRTRIGSWIFGRVWEAERSRLIPSST